MQEKATSRSQPLVAASANEAMFEHAAREVGAELTLHEAEHGMLALSFPREERLELFTDDGVEDGLLGPASRVGERSGRSAITSGNRQSDKHPCRAPASLSCALEPFYRAAGFNPTLAGLLRLAL